MCRRSQTKTHTNRNAEFAIAEEAAIHTDVYSSLDLSFKLIKLGWTTVAAPSHSRQTTWLKKWLGHTEQFRGEPTVTFIAFTPRSDLIRGAPVHTAVCKWRKADLLRAHVAVRRVLTCTGRPGDGVDVIMYADDVSSSINDKLTKKNKQLPGCNLAFGRFFFFFL